MLKGATQNVKVEWRMRHNTVPVQLVERIYYIDLKSEMERGSSLKVTVPTLSALFQYNKITSDSI